MHRNRRTLFLSLLLPLATLTGVAGCDAPEEDLGAVTLRPGGGFGCGWCTLNSGNSPNINGANLSDINLDVVNSNGTNTTGIKLRNGNTTGNQPFRLVVDPATERFVGVELDDPENVIVPATDMLGAKIVLEMPNTGETVHLEITAMDPSIASWASNGKPITAYRAHYFDNQGTPQPLCPTTNPENQWFTLILGETYDPTTHEIVARQDFVSVVCVGEAAAKMKLMDYGPQGNRGAGLDERTATLRMITADYCGTGHSFTASGTQVAWRNADSTVLPPFKETVLEAKWGPDGALCLDTPRYVDLDEVSMHCSIPACKNDDIDDGVMWRTMLP